MSMQLEQVEPESDTEFPEQNIHTVSESDDRHDMSDSDHSDATTADYTASLTVTDNDSSRIYLNDAANWPCQILDSQQIFLVRQGPCQIDNIKFP